MATLKNNILILGGTGAMGSALVDILSNRDDVSYISVTSRNQHDNYGKVNYITGNALDMDFINSVLTEQKWNTIVDFMSYNTLEFSERYDAFLENCDQYIFISSCRVYDKCDGKINEKTGRLLDCSTDSDFLKTDEYSLSKARQEDLLFQSNKKNYTIVRPSITYNSHRLQLGVLEKEHWLYRAIHGRSIVFSHDIASKLTAMTHGIDVAKAISNLVGTKDALGEAFHITHTKSYTWEEILNVYLNVLEDTLGKRPKVVFTEKSTCFKTKWNIYQIIYCRYFDRTFDNEKISKYVDLDKFIDIETGIGQSLKQFLKNPQFKQINWQLEAINDSAAKEYTPLKQIPSTKAKLMYICYRHKMPIVWKLIAKSMILIKRMCKNV